MATCGGDATTYVEYSVGPDTSDSRLRVGLFLLLRKALHEKDHRVTRRAGSSGDLYRSHPGRRMNWPKPLVIVGVNETVSYDLLLHFQIEFANDKWRMSNLKCQMNWSINLVGCDARGCFEATHFEDLYALILHSGCYALKNILGEVFG